MSDNFKRYNEEIEAYNQAAVAVVEKYGFAINDLYTLSTTLPEDAHSDPVHYYTTMGTEAFTNQTLKQLARAIDYPGAICYREAMYTDAPIGI